MQTRKLLLLEDDPVVRTGLANQLQLEGYEVRSAGDGQEALQMIKSQRPDLVVLDLGLPFNDPSDPWKDGFAVLGWLQRTLGDDSPPVVIHTGRVSPAIAARAKASGVIALFEKGAKTGELLATIRQTFLRIEAGSGLAA